MVCTHNGAARLKTCLRSLVGQTAPVDRFDVIIIDNNSTDSTHEIARDFVCHLHNGKVFKESQIGLSHARNRGLKEAAGEYIAYLDDDAKATTTWIEQALTIIEEQGPDIFGGPIYPFYETAPPAWVKDEYNCYSVYEGAQYLESGQFLSGSNLFLRRDLLSEYGGFDPELGMVGEHAGYHEETALQIRAQTEGRRIYYDPGLQVLHLVPPSKQNILYYLYSHYKSGKDGAYVWPVEHNCDELLSLLKDIDAFFMNIETAVKSRDPREHPYPENYMVEELLPRLFEIGRSLAYWSRYQRGRATMLKLLKPEKDDLLGTSNRTDAQPEARGLAESVAKPPDVRSGR